MRCKAMFGMKTKSWPFGCYTQRTPSGSCACLPGKKYGNIFMFRTLCPDSARGSNSSEGSFCLEQLQTKFSRWQPPINRLVGVAFFLILTWSVLGYGVFRVFIPNEPIKREKAQKLGKIGQELVQKGENKKALIAFQKALKNDPKNPNIHFHFGKCLIELKRYSEALEEFGKAVKFNPEMWEAYLEVAKLANKARYLETCGKNARKVSELNPNSIDAYLLLASTLIKKGLPEKAVAPLKIAINLPNIDQKNYERAGELFFLSKNWEESGKCYKQALESNPDSINSLSGLAYVSISKKQWDVAEKHIETILSKDSKNVKGLAARAKLYFAQGQTQKAIGEYEAIMKLDPDNPNFPLWLSTLLIGTNETDRGITILKELVARRPGFLEALTLLSQTYFKEKRFHLAAEMANKILSLPNSKNIQARILLAKTYFEMENYTSAIDPLEKAMEEFPNSFDLTLRLAYAYQQTGDVEKAVALFEEASLLDKKSSLPERYLGTIYERKNQIDDAISFYRKSLKKNPNDKKLMNQLALLLLKRNKTGDMEIAFELASRNHLNEPGNSYYAGTLGLAFYYLEEFLKAIDVLEKAIAIDPLFPEPYYYLGKIYAKQNQAIKAKNALRKALSLSSSFQGVEEAKKLLGELLETDNVNLLKEKITE